MQRKRLLLLFGSFALLTCALLVRGQEVKHTASPTDVANTLDRLVQPRFLIDAGKFGMERLAIAGHEDQSEGEEEAVYRLEAKNKTERRLLRAANAARRDYTIGFIHYPHKPGTFLPASKINSGSVSKSIIPGDGFQTLVVHEGKSNNYDLPDGDAAEYWDKRNFERVNPAIKKALPRAKQGYSVDVQTGHWLLAFRPIRASQASCVGCHRGAKQGDTLGVMAYAVSTKRR